MTNRLEGNIWKLFVAEFTQRRYFFPILSIYYLTLPDSNAVQIGIWTGLGYLGEFLFEIPSGYLADRIGHKRILVVSKLLLIAAVLCLIFASSITLFIIGAVLISLSFAAESGTKTAFLRETLASMRKEKMLVAMSSRIFANARLVSAFLFLIVPLGVHFSIRTPLYIGLALDVIGLLVVLLLVNPRITTRSAPAKSVMKIMRELQHTGFYPVAIFTGAITGFMISSGSYIYPYLESLGFPIAFVGIISGARLFGQFVLGHSIVRFESKLNIRKIFVFDLLLFSIGFALVAFFDNVILISIILIAFGSYGVGRGAFIDGYLSKHFVRDKKYTATALSVKGQITMLFTFAVVAAAGVVMNISYEVGYYLMAATLFVILATTLFFVKDTKPT